MRLQRHACVVGMFASGKTSRFDIWCKADNRKSSENVTLAIGSKYKEEAHLLNPHDTVVIMHSNRGRTCITHHAPQVGLTPVPCNGQIIVLHVLASRCSCKVTPQNYCVTSTLPTANGRVSRPVIVHIEISKDDQQNQTQSGQLQL